MSRTTKKSTSVEEKTQEMKEVLKMSDEMLAILPGAIRKPKNNLSKAMIWVYGPPKIGKTSLAADFPGTWFFATEKGQDWVTIREPTLVPDWQSFIDVCNVIDEHQPTTFQDGSPIETLVIDTVDNLFISCTKYVSEVLGVEHPSDAAYGKGWSRLSEEWQRVFGRIRMWPYGLIAISHGREKVIKKRNSEITRFEPEIGAGGLRILNAMSDLILYCFTEERAETDEKGEPTGKIVNDRLMMAHPSQYAIAGGRMAKMLPAILPLSYEELSKHFKQASK